MTARLVPAGAVLLAVVVLSGCAGTDRPSAPAVSGVPANGSHRFLADHDGRPLTWSRCRPITWKLNAGGVDGDVVEVVRDAVDRMAGSSGFELTDAGVTDAVEGSSTDVPQALGVDVLVEVVPDDATDLLSGSEWARTDVRPVDGRIGQAIVAISASADGRLAVDDGPLSWRTLVMHEFGHVLGLAESDDPDDLMYPALGEGSGRISADDLAGLQALADAGTCRAGEPGR